jgi:hypothetical protein
MWRWAFARMYLFCSRHSWDRRHPEWLAVTQLTIVIAFGVMEVVLLAEVAMRRQLNVHLFDGWKYVLGGVLWSLNYFRFVRRGDADGLIAELEQYDDEELRREFFKVWALIVFVLVLAVSTVIAFGGPTHAVPR